MKKRTKQMERKLAKLRRKYCEGICSEQYIKTGIPQIRTERLLQAAEEIKPIMKENEKNVKEAIKNAKKARKGRRTKTEDKMIFV